MPGRGLGLATFAGYDIGAEDLIDRPDTDTRSAAALNDYAWGGGPPPVTQIPYSWLSQPLRFRPDTPINVAAVTQASGTPAVSVNTVSVAAYGEFAASPITLSTICDADPANLAAHLTGNYADPRMRCPQVTLDLLERTALEMWLILGRFEGDRIQITGTPGLPRVLNTNPYFETDASGWSAQGGTVARSTAQAHEGVASLLLTPNGVATAEADAAAVPIVAGNTYTASAWAYCAVARNVFITINWFGSTGAYISTATSSSVAVAANAWTPLSVSAVAPGTAGRGAPIIGMSSTPPNTNLLWIDAATLFGIPANEGPWPDGTTSLLIEGIQHTGGVDDRVVVWNTSPVIGSTPGIPGPWFRTDSSRLDGADRLPF